MKKRKGLFIGIGVVIVLTFVCAVIWPQGGVKETTCDTTALQGVYEGKATLDIPDKFKAMAKDANGNKLIPDEPIACKVQIKQGEQGGVQIELVDFKMPVEGIELKPVQCGVSLKDAVYALEGKGEIAYGEQKFAYSHRGKMQDNELELSATLTIVPFVIEPKVVFKGRRGI